MDSQKKFFPKLYPLDKEINRTWFVEYTDLNGKKKKIYGRLNHLPTIEERIKEAESIFKELTGKVYAPQLQNQLIRDLSEIFELRQEGCRKKTISAYQTHFFSFCKWYYANKCPQVDTLQATKFLNSLNVSNTTRNTYRRNLKSFFDDLQRCYQQRYRENPFAHTRKLREASKTKEWFKPAVVPKLIEAIAKDKQLLLAVKIMFHCFARPNEIRQLKIADINFETKRLRIESNVAKTVRIRYVPIPAELLVDLEFLKLFPDHFFLFGNDGCPGIEHMGRDTLSKRHKKIMEAFKFSSGYTFYSWKNTGAVKMLMMDRKTMRYISKCMGHHSLDMTDKYFESLGVDEMGETIIFPSLHQQF